MVIKKLMKKILIGLLITAGATEYAQASQAPSSWVYSIIAPLYSLSPRTKVVLAIGVTMLGMGAIYQNQQNKVESQAKQLALLKSKLLAMQDMVESFNTYFDLSDRNYYDSFLNQLVVYIADIDQHLSAQNKIELQILSAYLSTARSDESRKLMIIKFREWIADQLNAQSL